MIRHKRLCIFPSPHGVGGMVSFQARLAAGMRRRGWDIHHDPDDTPYDALLVIGGTRHLWRLLQVRRKGIPIVQRLNGMNWLQRRRRTGIHHTIRAEMGNLFLSTIRRRIADHVVYQSVFSREWWEREYGKTIVPWTVIYNGVDTTEFSPAENPTPPAMGEMTHLLMVEGTLGGGYEMGLESGVRLGEGLRTEGWQMDLTVAGKVPESVQRLWKDKTTLPIRWAGLLDVQEIPALDRSSHLFYAADLNPACPNAVIEAMACGLPCVAFDTGALGEIVRGKSGAIVPYGGDPWRLEPPDVAGLVKAAARVLHSWDEHARTARQTALESFDLETMLDSYLEVFAQC